MFKKVTFIITALFCAVPAFAAAPIVTDDTGTQGKGKYQFEVDYAGGVTKQYPGQQIATTLTYGALDNVDLILSIPYNWHTIVWEGNPLNTYDRVNDTSLQVKWRFFDAGVKGRLNNATPPTTVLAGITTRF